MCVPRSKDEKENKEKKIIKNQCEKSLEHNMYQYQQHNHRLKSQSECVWERHYKDNLISQYIRQPVNQKVKNIITTLYH